MKKSLNKDLNIVYVPLEKIIPYDNNPKLHSPANIKKLVKSMTIKPGEILFHQPIALDKDNVIISGHGRRLAALELDMKTVPCVYMNDISDQEAIALRLADNDAFSLEYDIQMLEQENKKLSASLQDHLYPDVNMDDLKKEADALFQSSFTDLDTDTKSKSKSKNKSSTVDLPEPDTDTDDLDDDEKPDRLETSLCKRLAEELGGENEARTPIGWIDVLTNTELIEVKRVRKWKWALGQILVYGLYHPDLQKRIHLFGKIKESKLQMIKDHCSKFDVVVTWQYEEFRP